MNFETICQLCREARELALQLGIKASAMYLRAHNVAIEFAMSCLVRKPLAV